MNPSSNACSGILPTPPCLAEDVPEKEVLRLLGYPPGHTISCQVQRLNKETRSWYEENGQPWVFARELGLEPSNNEVLLSIQGGGSSVRLQSKRLLERLKESEASSIVLIAITAGDLDPTVRRLFPERPDASYFLDRFGAAVAEHLVGWAHGTLGNVLAKEGKAVLPGMSPGHDGWPLEDQETVFKALALPRPNPLHLLPSQMIAPKNSLLCAFGVTLAGKITEARKIARWPCTDCTLPDCQFRRSK